MGCCEITGYMWGQCEALKWAVEILAVNEIYKISHSRSFISDFQIILSPDITAGEILTVTKIALSFSVD